MGPGYVSMIIESSLSSSQRLIRRTALDHTTTGHASSLDDVLHSLLTQWGLLEEAHQGQGQGQADPSSRYCLLVQVDDSGSSGGSAAAPRYLVIDKQHEWALFCEQTATDHRQPIVKVQLATQASLLSER